MRQSQTMVDVSEPEDVTAVQLSSLFPRERFYGIHCFSLLPQVNLITRSISGSSMLKESSIISFNLHPCQEWRTKHLTILLWRALKLLTDERGCGVFSTLCEWSGVKSTCVTVVGRYLQKVTWGFDFIPHCSFFPGPHFSLSHRWYNWSESIRGGLKPNVTKVRRE